MKNQNPTSWELIRNANSQSPPIESESALEQDLQGILMHMRLTEAKMDCIYYIDSLSP